MQSFLCFEYQEVWIVRTVRILICSTSVVYRKHVVAHRVLGKTNLRVLHTLSFCHPVLLPESTRDFGVPKPFFVAPWLDFPPWAFVFQMHPSRFSVPHAHCDMSLTCSFILFYLTKHLVFQSLLLQLFHCQYVLRWDMVASQPRAKLSGWQYSETHFFSTLVQGSGYKQACDAEDAKMCSNPFIYSSVYKCISNWEVLLWERKKRCYIWVWVLSMRNAIRLRAPSIFNESFLHVTLLSLNRVLM